MLVFDAASLDGKHVDAKHMAQCLVAESRQLVMQLVGHGPAFTAAKSSVHRDCWEESLLDPQILGCAPEVLELLGLHSSLLHSNLDISLIRQGGDQWTAKAFEFIGAMDMTAISFAKADCFGDKLFHGEGCGPGRIAHSLCF